MKIELTPTEVKLLRFLCRKALDYGESGPLVYDKPCQRETCDQNGGQEIIMVDSTEIAFDAQRGKQVESILRKLPIIAD